MDLVQCILDCSEYMSNHTLHVVVALLVMKIAELA